MSNQDLEQFIAEHSMPWTLATGDTMVTERMVSATDLLAWMTGHVRVPLEPSEEMIEAGCKHHECQQQDPWYSNDELSEYDCTAIYKAMINAHKETV